MQKARENSSNLVIVISGPSGVGKDAVLHYLKKSSPSFTFVTTMTTRPRRRNEKDDIDYRTYIIAAM